MSNEVVLYDKKDSGVALISLNRPDRLNAITGELTARLKEKIDDACKDDDIKVIVLTGSGRGFSAGADMDSLSDISAIIKKKIQINLKTVTMKPMVYRNGKAHIVTFLLYQSR